MKQIIEMVELYMIDNGFKLVDYTKGRDYFELDFELAEPDEYIEGIKVSYSDDFEVRLWSRGIVYYSYGSTLDIAINNLLMQLERINV